MILHQAFVIPVFFHNDNTASMKDCGLDYPLTECDKRPFYFYQISGLSIYYDEKDGDRAYCSIHSNGTEYIATEPIEAIQKRLERHYTNMNVYR